MSTTDYLINAFLILLVLVQIRERVMDRRSLLLPLAAVAGAGAYYLKSVPTSGHDLLLDITLALTGALIGGLCAAATRVWRRADGKVVTKAGLVAAILWIVGIGARGVFEYFANHSGGPAIERFSRAHAITGSNAWVAALVIMALAEVLTRLVVLRVRGRQLAASAAELSMQVA